LEFKKWKKVWDFGHNLNLIPAKQTATTEAPNQHSIRTITKEQRYHLGWSTVATVQCTVNKVKKATSFVNGNVKVFIGGVKSAT
jgi:hypothetical protein